uniref:BTB domain-containing protein n=1 Tax=Anopheles stephensi TaxID=30069 RepID=A0A182YPK1_ANOST
MAHSIVRTKNRWTTAQLELLVDVWGKYYQQLKAGRGHEEIYEMMVDELKEAGCLEATVKQVRGRIHNLSGKYRKEASEVLKTGIPSQWSLYSKISKFFEYSAPARFKNLGPPVYDMTEYLDMDLVMTGVIERHASNRNRADDHPAEFELEENSLDMEDDEVEPGDGSADRANREEYSDMGMYDDENTLDEFPVEDERRSGSRSGEEQEHVQQQSEHEEESVVKESERDDTDEDGDSTAEDDDITVLEQQTQKSSEVFHIEGDFRQAAIEEFLCQLYSNQLYADVMLITCHEGVTCVMPAHRMVLANFSEFFSSVLGALKPNTNGNPITLCLQPDISQRIMQLLLQYMYTGKASVPKGLLADFLRCGQILRVRGIWNEERGKAPAKPAAIKPPAVVNVSKEMHTRAPSSISDEEEERSLSSSSVTKTADLSPKDTGSSTSSSETEQSTVTERSKKRRKKMSKKASKMRRVASEEDDDSDDVEVSSKVGFDLLRSDSETEDKTTTESRDRRSATSDGVSEGSEGDDDDDESYDDEDDDSTDDYDDYEEEEEDLDDEKGSVEDDEEEDEEDNGNGIH